MNFPQMATGPAEASSGPRVLGIENHILIQS
jgi:hypothetical protein